MEITVLQKLKGDLRKSAVTLTATEIRYLVDLYYMTQEDRKRAGNQRLALEKSGEPHALIAYFHEQQAELEKQIKGVLDAYTNGHVMGSWMRGIHGIGPVLSAGILAHIDIHKAPTVGHIWRYAGLDPTQKWIGREGANERIKELAAAGLQLPEMVQHLADTIGTRAELIRTRATNDNGKITKESLAKAAAIRPWNEQLKVLCWKIGQSFMKFAAAEACTYGHWYKQRKQIELERDASGKFREYAIANASRYGKSTDAFKHMTEGHLPPAQIDARARRWAVKLFLSHLHGEWYRREFGKEPPLPYPIAHLGHAHFIDADDKVPA